jgi:putative flippase GtrA
MSVTELSKSPQEVPCKSLSGLRRLYLRFVTGQRWGRLIRYGATSGMSTVFSEAMLIGLTATATLGATSSALLANLVATVPSYLLSRYWIWPEADRDRIGRQVSLYWITSILSTVLSTVVTKVVASSITIHGDPRALVLGAAFLGTYAVFWFAKYVMYHRWLFVGSAPDSTPEPTPESR